MHVGNITDLPDCPFFFRSYCVMYFANLLSSFVPRTTVIDDRTRSAVIRVLWTVERLGQLARVLYRLALLGRLL
jgi:hypothetical protein